MKYFYLVRNVSNHSIAYSNRPTITELNMAKAHNCEWITEENAIERKLEIPNDSGHYGIITQSRTFNVPIKLEDKAIWIFWIGKWYAVREYNGKNPSKKVMDQVEKTFRLNSGMPINHDVLFNWKEVQNA